MKRLQAFKYELMPDGEQQRNRRRFAGSAALYSTRRWRCNKPIMQKAKKSCLMPICANT
jgi:putative transposase